MASCLMFNQLLIHLAARRLQSEIRRASQVMCDYSKYAQADSLINR